MFLASCARISWPSRQLFSAREYTTRKYTASYRIVGVHRCYCVLWIHCNSTRSLISALACWALVIFMFAVLLSDLSTLSQSFYTAVCPESNWNRRNLATSFRSIFGEIFTAHAPKRLLESFLSKIWHHRPISRPNFLIERIFLSIKKHFLAFLTVVWCTCAKMALFILLVRYLIAPYFSTTSISYNKIKILAIWQLFGGF